MSAGGAGPANSPRLESCRRCAVGVADVVDAEDVVVVRFLPTP